MSNQWRAGRIFSVAQANALVPFLTASFSRITKVRGELTKGLAALEAAGHPVDERMLEDPTAAPPEVARDLDGLRALHAVIVGLVDELTGLGIEVKALDGLVDVRSRFEGRIVYLCWQMGEAAFDHWHDLESGFSGRRPLEHASAFEGQLLN
jgi:hypothetical protein